MTLLQVADDLKTQAERLRADHPDIAQKLESDRDVILEHEGPLTTNEAAKLLGTTKPTILDWVRRGVLDKHWRSTPFGTLITAASVAAILPAIRQWNETGRDGRALRRIMESMRDDLDTELRQAVSKARTQEGRPVVARGAYGHVSRRRKADSRQKPDSRSEASA